jgi:hypothetical protein
VNGVPHAAQQRADLLVRQDLGKTELLGRAVSFLKQRPLAIQGPAVEELDAAVMGLERAERGAAFAQA